MVRQAIEGLCGSFQVLCLYSENIPFHPLDSKVFFFFFPQQVDFSFRRLTLQKYHHSFSLRTYQRSPQNPCSYIIPNLLNIPPYIPQRATGSLLLAGC